MTSAEIIRAFGGATSLSIETGIKRSAISMWIPDGIPSRHWFRLCKLAESKNVEGISMEVLSEHTRSRDRIDNVSNTQVSEVA